jgi:uncharacterized protein (TIGR02118 family)
VTPRPSRPPRLEIPPAGYRLLLCQRRPQGVTRSAFQQGAAALLDDAALRLRSALGFTRLERIDQVTHPNLLGHTMAKTRTWIPVALAALWTGKKPPRPGNVVPEESREFDVIQEFSWDSEEHLLSTLGSANGKRAAEELAGLARPLVDHTSVIAGPQYPVLPREAGHPATKVMFCLRRRRGMDRGAMQTYWREQHGALVRSLQPKLKTRGYEQVHAATSTRVEELAALLRVGSRKPFDGAAALWYDTPQALLATFAQPACQRANVALQVDEPNFVDGNRCVLVFGEEREVAA